MLRSILLSVAAVTAALFLSYANGPRGGTQEEKQLLHEAVIGGRANLYGDEIPIAATPRLLERASKELLALGDPTLFGYEAAFYIFPKEGKAITLPGALLPAGESIHDIPNAIMHVRADAKTMVRLNELPPSTIVYGVDVTGNKAWYPLELFTAHSIHPGFISADGFYAYTYRPSAKLYGRYGETAYYLDILSPEMIEQARLELEDNITLLGTQIPDATARVAWFSRSAFFAPLVPRFHDLDMLRNIRFEITMFADKGLIDVRLPYGIEYERTGESVEVYPLGILFDGLAQFRETVALQLEMENLYGEADAVRDMELSVTHFNSTGDLSVVKKEPDDATFMLNIKADGDEFSREARPGQAIVAEDEFTRRLGRHLDATGRVRSRKPATEHSAMDWKTVYDTGLDNVKRPARPQRDKEGPAGIVAYKPYELDVQPTFRGGDFDSFRDWLYSEVKLPGAEGVYSDAVVVEFVVDEEGSVVYIEEVETTWHGLMQVVYGVMATALHDWTPGEIAGIPVLTRYRMVLSM